MEVADLAGKPVAKVFKSRSQVIRQHLALDFEFIKLIWALPRTPIQPISPQNLVYKPLFEASP